MARVARNGLHSTWTPVKLADLFKEIAPGISDQISVASEIFNSEGKPATIQSARDEELAIALQCYTDLISNDHGVKLTEDQQTLVDEVITSSAIGKRSAPEQIKAFRDVTEGLIGSGLDVSSEKAVQFRRQARAHAGLNLMREVNAPATIQPRNQSPEKSAALLDTEVIAMYW